MDHLKEKENRCVGISHVVMKEYFVLNISEILLTISFGIWDLTLYFLGSAGLKSVFLKRYSQLYFTTFCSFSFSVGPNFKKSKWGPKVKQSQLA